MATARGIGRVLVEPNPVSDAFHAAHTFTVHRGKGRWRRIVCSCGRLDKRTVDSNVRMHEAFHRSDEWPAWSRANLACPDDGYCHHAESCSPRRCWRVEACGPLSNVFPNDDWPWSKHGPMLRVIV